MANVYFNVPNKTPAWLIFYTQWDVSVKRIHLITEADTRHFGLPVSKQQGRDSYMNEMADVRLSLATLADMYADGISFSVRNPTDTVEMYKILLQHLESARDAWTRMGLTHKPPKDDLKKMDQLAGALYNIATAFEERGALGGGLMSYLNRLNGSRIGTAKLFNDYAQQAGQKPGEFKYESPIAGVGGKSLKGGRQWDSNPR
jgi:hypothetical protein